MFFALSSNQTWIKDHVNLFIALAPIARMDYTNMFNIQTIAEFTSPIDAILNFNHIYALFSKADKDKFTHIVSSPIFSWANIQDRIFMIAR